MPLVIAGERSGVGKTTVTLALLAALKRQHCQVQSFKVGPDYIDPMFHRYITGRSSRNLDPILTSETYVQRCFEFHCQLANCAIVEGVMGLFDGASGTDDWGSTAHIARLLQLPVLLVLDCSRLSRSVAAIAHGYRSFDPRIQLAGLVLNRVGSDRHLDLLKSALEPLQIPILGILRRQDSITIPDRHLGLIPTAELPELDRIIEQLAELGQTCFDWTQLRPLVAANQPEKTAPPFKSAMPLSRRTIRIAVAFDRAFNFYYADNLDLLEELGAELVYWSPIAEPLPEDIHGLYFGGGFPEVFAAELSDNSATRQSVKLAIQAGMPTYAECGGLMYLSEKILNFAGQAWEMVGVLPTTAQMGQRLTLGYRRAIALQDTPLLPKEAIVWGHEFHRSTLTLPPDSPLYQIQGYDPQSPILSEGWQLPHLHASYVHLHWGDRPEIPARFLAQCAQFQATS
jgi:cobyrinic acid a,c-diamide synthase